MLPNEKEALHDVDDRIGMLQRRLDNAKAARDAFVHHLRGKYPDWTPPLPVMSYQEADFPAFAPNPTMSSNEFQNREPLVSRLATASYQWDVDQGQGMRDRMMIRSRPSYRAISANYSGDIPTSGPLLESDIRRSRIRLREISEELRSMRIDRMNLSTEQWMQERSYREHKALNLNFGPAHNTDQPQPDLLDDVSADLARIEFTQTSPIETPKTERKIEIEMTENHEKLLAEMRAELQSQAPPPMTSDTYATPILAPPTFTSTSQAVRFQEPTVPAPVVAPPPVVQEPPVQAPPIQASPLQAPPTKPDAASDILNQIGSYGGGGMFGISDSDSDEPPSKFKTPAKTSGLNNYSSLLAVLGNTGGDISSDDDDDIANNMLSSVLKPKKGGASKENDLAFFDDY